VRQAECFRRCERPIVRTWISIETRDWQEQILDATALQINQVVHVQAQPFQQARREPFGGLPSGIAGEAACPIQAVLRVRPGPRRDGRRVPRGQRHHCAGHVRSATAAFPRPSVIRLVYMIKRPRPQMRLTRREVFQRDRFTCMYCGKQSRDLTLDHVFPRHRGGAHTWENLVSACKPCNHRKAGRTPQEARMHLLREPFHPRTSAYYIFYQYLNAQQEWRKFIPGWEQDTGFGA